MRHMTALFFFILFFEQMMMNLTFYFIWIFIFFNVNKCTYKRFDNMLAAVETLDSYDCIESHHQYQGHLQVAISMNWKLTTNLKIDFNELKVNKERSKKIIIIIIFKRWGQWKKNEGLNVRKTKPIRTTHRNFFGISCGKRVHAVQFRVILFDISFFFHFSHSHCILCFFLLWSLSLVSLAKYIFCEWARTHLTKHDVGERIRERVSELESQPKK